MPHELVMQERCVRRVSNQARLEEDRQRVVLRRMQSTEKERSMTKETAKLLPVMLLLLLGACIRTGHHVIGPYQNCDDCSQTAKDLAWSLDNEHSAWENNGFAICERLGSTCLWYSNGKSDLTGGQNFSGKGWEPSGNDRSLVWGAIQRWQQEDLK